MKKVILIPRPQPKDNIDPTVPIQNKVVDRWQKISAEFTPNYKKLDKKIRIVYH